MHWHYWLGFSLFLAPSMCLCVCRRHVVFFFCGGCIVSLTLTGLRSNGFENFDECHQRLPSTQWWTEKGWTLNFRWTVPFQYVAIGAHIAIRFPPAKRKKKILQLRLQYSVATRPPSCWKTRKRFRKRRKLSLCRFELWREGGTQTKNGGKTKGILFGKLLPIAGSQITARHGTQENVNIFSTKSALREMLSVVIYPKLDNACHLEELIHWK